MNRLSLTLVCFLLLAAAACTTPPSTPTAAPLPTATTQLAAAPTQATATVSLPTATAPLPTPTPIPQPPTHTPNPTETATSLPTLVPTFTPMPPPPPSGQIYFFWDPKHISDININPVNNLYLATPGQTFENWNIAPLVEGIIGFPQIALSPGKTKFAFTILEDKNGDGYVSNEGYDRGLDAPNIFAYDLLAGELARLTSEYFGWYLGWLSDNELAVGLRAISTEDLSWRQMVSEEETPDNIKGITLAPNGKTIAIIQNSGQISLLKSESGELVTVANELDSSDIEMTFSADGKWLVLNQPSLGRFTLVNNETLEAIPIQLSYSIRYLVWSPDNQYIAAIQEMTEGISVFLLNVSDMSTESLLTTSKQVYGLIWSPDSSQLAMSITDGNSDAILGVIDIQTSDFRELWQSTESPKFYVYAWSPDNEWLLFFTGQSWSPIDDEAGVFFIHKNGGDPYLILETSGSRDPYAFFWLPEMNAP